MPLTFNSICSSEPVQSLTITIAFVAQVDTGGSHVSVWSPAKPGHHSIRLGQLYGCRVCETQEKQSSTVRHGQLTARHRLCHRRCNSYRQKCIVTPQIHTHLLSPLVLYIFSSFRLILFPNSQPCLSQSPPSLNHPRSFHITTSSKNNPLPKARTNEHSSAPCSARVPCLS